MFPCSNCGLCCQNISTVKELKDFDLGNGICKFYVTETQSCGIYETRPDICRVDKMFTLKYYKDYSKEEFYKLNAKACNEIQAKYQFDISYKINIGE